MLKVTAFTSNSPMEDTASILHLIQKQLESIGSPKSLEHIRQAIATIFSTDNQAVLFVGYDINSTPVAFAFGNTGVGLESGGKYFWLNDLYVDTSCRNRGYADTMLSFIEAWLKDNQTNYLACVTGQDNFAAQNLYRKKGFAVSTTVWIDKSL